MLSIHLRVFTNFKLYYFFGLLSIHRIHILSILSIIYIFSTTIHICHLLLTFGRRIHSRIVCYHSCILCCTLDRINQFIDSLSLLLMLSNFLFLDRLFFCLCIHPLIVVLSNKKYDLFCNCSQSIDNHLCWMVDTKI